MMPSPEQQAQAAGLDYGGGAATLPASDFSMENWCPPPGPDADYEASAQPLRSQQCAPPQHVPRPPQLQDPHLSGWYQTSMAHGCGAQQQDSSYTSTPGQVPPDLIPGLMGAGGMAPSIDL